jgi:hypothetical protein
VDSAATPTQCTPPRESRTLAIVGAFRVVSARDLRDHDGRPADPRFGDLRRLREQGLIRTERREGHRDAVVVFTKERRNLLDRIGATTRSAATTIARTASRRPTRS